MGTRVTMQMIADRIGVTKVSVSKALNDQPGISDELRSRILQEARRLGYVKRPNTSARIQRLGILVPKRFFFEEEDFYTGIYYHLLKECTSKKIQLLLEVLGSADERNNVLPFTLERNSLDGLFIGGEVSDGYFEFISNMRLPCVGIDFYKLKMSIDCVIVDNFHASFLATSYLIDHGHREIGFIGNSSLTSSVTDRYYGYLKALDQKGLKCRDEWVLQNKDGDGMDCDYALPETLPTAFVCHCDEAARDLVLKLKRSGVAVPGQVSVISFDNTKYSLNCTPQITTMEISKREIAIKVLEQMIWRIKNPSEPPQRIMLEAKLIERESVRTIER